MKPMTHLGQYVCVDKIVVATVFLSRCLHFRSTTKSPTVTNVLANSSVRFHQMDSLQSNSSGIVTNSDMMFFANF